MHNARHCKDKQLTTHRTVIYFYIHNICRKKVSTNDHQISLLRYVHLHVKMASFFEVRSLPIVRQSGHIEHLWRTVGLFYTLVHIIHLKLKFGFSFTYLTWSN